MDTQLKRGVVRREWKRWEPKVRVKLLISAFAVALVTAHHLWPNIKPDLATLVLLIVALLPWFGPIIKSLELPGGFKIELQDVKAATEKIPESVPAQPSTRASIDTAAYAKEKDLASDYDRVVTILGEVARIDPRLALVGIRIEIERRLRQMAEMGGIEGRNKSLMAITRVLIDRQNLDQKTANGLLELVSLGNSAAHGASVEPGAADLVLSRATDILKALDAWIEDGQNLS